jgi:hypothetical protein
MKIKGFYSQKQFEKAETPNKENKEVVNQSESVSGIDLDGLSVSQIERIKQM